MTKSNAQELAISIAKQLIEKKALDIKILDISNLTTICDYFVIASGRTEVQVRAMCDEIEKFLTINEYRTCRKEGYRNGRWIVYDCRDVVVHLFHTDVRKFYDLERLWTDGIYVTTDNLSQ